MTFESGSAAFASPDNNEQSDYVGDLNIGNETIRPHEEYMREDIAQLVDQLPTPELMPAVRGQLSNYINAIAEITIESCGTTELSEAQCKEFAMLYFKMARFIDTRNRRTDEIQSETIQAVIESKKEMFGGTIPYLWLCIDGRIGSKIFAGLHGHAYRTPAGDSVEFLPKNKYADQLVLDPEGQFAQLSDEALAQEDFVIQVLDSHTGCAARGNEAAHDHGTDLPDHGLMEDVQRKKAMARAMYEYTLGRFEGKKKIEIIQTSFDPHNGYMYMGLDRDEVLNDPLVQAEGFTGEVEFGDDEQRVNPDTNILSSLITSEKIISTQALVEEPESKIRKIFHRHFFDVNYEEQYVSSTISFWENIERMKDLPISPETSETTLETFKNKIVSVMPELEGNDKAEEVHHRAMLLLANAYGGYLHNYRADDSKHNEYKYKEHKESVIVITLSEKGPFESPTSFSIDPKNHSLDDAIKLGDKLIRSNRTREAMSDAEKEAVKILYGEKSKTYVKNPVPVIGFERLREGTEKSVIDTLQSINWSDVISWEDEHGNNWKETDYKKFGDYLEGKYPNIPAHVAITIQELRDRASKFYEATDPTVVRLLSKGRIEPLWWITDSKRRNIAAIPFSTRLSSKYFTPINPKRGKGSTAQTD